MKVVQLKRMVIHVWHRVVARQLLEDVGVYSKWVDQLQEDMWDQQEKIEKLEFHRNEIGLQDGVWQVHRANGGRPSAWRIDKEFAEYFGKWGSVEQTRFDFTGR